MARHSWIYTSPCFLVVDLVKQLLPGSFKCSAQHLLAREIDLGSGGFVLFPGRVWEGQQQAGDAGGGFQAGLQVGLAGDALEQGEIGAGHGLVGEPVPGSGGAAPAFQQDVQAPDGAAAQVVDHEMPPYRPGSMGRTVSPSPASPRLSQRFLPSGACRRRCSNRAALCPRIGAAGAVFRPQGRGPVGGRKNPPVREPFAWGCYPELTVPVFGAVAAPSGCRCVPPTLVPAP